MSKCTSQYTAEQKNFPVNSDQLNQNLNKCVKIKLVASSNMEAHNDHQYEHHQPVDLVNISFAPTHNITVDNKDFEEEEKHHLTNQSRKRSSSNTSKARRSSKKVLLNSKDNKIEGNGRLLKSSMNQVETSQLDSQLDILTMQAANDTVSLTPNYTKIVEQEMKELRDKR